MARSNLWVTLLHFASANAEGMLVFFCYLWIATVMSKTSGKAESPSTPQNRISENWILFIGLLAGPAAEPAVVGRGEIYFPWVCAQQQCTGVRKLARHFQSGCANCVQLQAGSSGEAMRKKYCLSVLWWALPKGCVGLPGLFATCLMLLAADPACDKWQCPCCHSASGLVAPEQLAAGWAVFTSSGPSVSCFVLEAGGTSMSRPQALEECLAWRTLPIASF